MIIVRLAEKFPKEIERGLTPNIFYISKYQVQQGHQVYVFSFTKEKPSEEIKDGIKIFRIKKPHFVRTFGGLALFKAIKEKGIKPDIVHGLNAIPFGWLFPLAKKCFITKYVLSVHGSILPLIKKYLTRLKDRLNSLEFSMLIVYLAKRVDLVLPIKSFIKKELISKGVPEEKIRIIPTGLDFNLFNKQAFPKEKQFTILYVGRFVQKKGIRYLIKALDLLRKEGILVKLKLVGGQKTDNDYHNIVNLIKKLNLQDQVGVKTAILYKELPQIYHSSHLFVFPSLDEDLGKVGLEAMACKLPVIATFPWGESEIIQHEKNGLLVPIKNEGAIAQAIKRIWENKELREKLIKNGEETAKKYDWKIIAQKYTQAFEELLAKK